MKGSMMMVPVASQSMFTQSFKKYVPRIHEFMQDPSCGFLSFMELRRKISSSMVPKLSANNC